MTTEKRTVQNKAESHISWEIKAAAVDTAERTFEGMLSTWELDHGLDIIEPGAFKRTLDHWRAQAGKRPIYLVDNHNYFSVFNILGKLVDAEERPDGLWTKWQVVEGEDGDKVLARVKNGMVAEMSIGYRTVAATCEDQTIDGMTQTVRRIQELKLMEGSLVFWGMNGGTQVFSESVKSLQALLQSARNGEHKVSVQELKALQDEISALLTVEVVETPEPPKGPAPEDAKRLQMEERLRNLMLAQLAT